MGQPPELALWPGDPARIFHVDTHVMTGADGVLQVHLTRYPPGEPTSYSRYAQQAQEHLTLHAHAHEPVEPHQELLAKASEVVVGQAGDDPPLLALDRLRRRRRNAFVVAVTDSDRAALAWLRTPGQQPGGGDAHLVTMTGNEPGPVALYASALFGWSLHSAEHRTDRGQVPAPPLCLDVVEAWRPYRVRLEQADPVSWPGW